MNLSPGSQPEVVGDPNLVKVFLRSLRDKVGGGDPLGAPAPDAPYTAADHNSPFLAYEYVEPVTGRRIAIPSFHRPQLLRNRAAADDYLTATPDAGNPNLPFGDRVGDALHPWYKNPLTLPYVYAPHLERRATAIDPERPGVNFQVLVGGSPATRKFVTGDAGLDGGTAAGYPDYAVVDANGLLDPGGTLGPVSPLDPTFVPPLDLRIAREPFLRAGDGDNPGAPTLTQYAYPADPDNDGVADAIYMDLGFPVQTDADGVRQYVPMMAFKVVDGDALFNLNAHGNTYGRLADADTNDLDDSRDLDSHNFRGNAPGGAEPTLLSRSDHGLGPHEVNPQHGLSGGIPDDFGGAHSDPARQAATEAFDQFFANVDDDPATAGENEREQTWTPSDNNVDHARLQSRNLEWWFLTHGRGTVVLGTPAGVTPDRDELFPGLYGEGPRLETAYAVQRAVLAGNAGSLPTGTLPPAAYYPYPGVSASQANTARGSGPDGDDDGDYLAGLRHVLPGLIFGGYDPLAPAASPVGRPMTAPADGVPLDRRGSGSWVNATGLGRLFLSAATASTDPAVGVRGRFPVLADAVLPLAYDDGTNVFGFANVTGPWQVVSDILNGLVLRSRDRTSANGTLPAEGGLAGVRTQPVAPGGTTALATGMGGVLDTFAGVSIDSLYGALLGGTGTDAWRRFNHLRIDDPDETVADYRRAAGQRSDSLYGPAEFAGLHASRRDRTVRDDLPSRLVELVPMSFLESDDAEAVRRRFTTVSFDVTTAAAPFEPNDARRSAGGDDRAWERTEDDGTVPADGTPTEEEKFFPPVFDPGGGKTLLAQQDPFRPELRSALASGVYDRIPADNPATTRVDEEDVARRDARSLVRKMSLNGVLERVTNPRDPLFDSAAYYVNPRAAATNADGVSTNLDGDAATSELGFGEIRVRPLTPHPAGLSAGRFDPPVGHPLSAADYFGTKLKVGDLPRFGVSDADLQESLFNDATGRFEPRREGTLTWDFPSPRGNVQRALQLQEWHARRDRQNLARDIYVLLYTLGGVDGTLSDLDYRMPHPNPGTDHYTPDQLREMAQFAVNVVDAMDGDSVQTLFVYDKNLAGDGTDNNIDGYTVLDDGYAAPPAVDDPYRGLVVGVERQDFALSEALVNISWTSENGGGDDRFADHPRTEWNDAAMHDFAFVELYYTGPGAYDFGENADLAAAGLPDRPGENYRVILREPGGTRQFTGAADGASGNPLSRVTARALVPRAGAVSADRPYFTLASADPGYATGNGSAIDETAPTPQGPRSRIRVNLRSAAPAYGNSGTDEWTNLAPLAFAPAGMPTGPQVTQGSPVSTSGDGTTDPSQVLDVLVPADTLGDPALEPFGAEDRAAYRLFDLDPDGTVNAPTPINSISGADWLTLAGTDSEKQSSPPTVEVILQRRANPLRFRNNHAAGTDFDLEERDNPWVTIDRMRVRATQLALDEGEDGLTTPGNAATAPTGTFVTALMEPANMGPGAESTNTGRKVASRVRRRPLLRASELAAFGRNASGIMVDSDRELELGAIVTNSIGGHSRVAPRRDLQYVPFDLWQPHYDRPFAGPADLVGVPLYGPGELTGLPSLADGAVTASVGGFAEFAAGTGEESRQIGLGYLAQPQPDPTDMLLDATAAALNRNSVAGSRLLYPDVRRDAHPATTMEGLAGVTAPGPGTGSFNMWYRLLQHVDTLRPTAGAPGALPGTVRLGPTARLDQDGTFDLGEVREPGRINLNTLRHPEVLAGLLDDLSVHEFAVSGGVPGATPVLPQLAPRGNHVPSPVVNDWYQALLLSRDGRDPLTSPPSWGAQKLGIPGLGGNRAAAGGADGSPFLPYMAPPESLDVTGDAAGAAVALRNAIQRTPLRARPQNAAFAPQTANGGYAGTLPRAFFGTGGEDVDGSDIRDLTPSSEFVDLDFTTRYRLLNKVLNNTTERSNAFLVWVQVDLFHARELRRGAVEPATEGTAAGRQRFTRIGAMRDDSPGYRWMAVVDRSRVPELLRASHLPTTVLPGTAQETKTYSFARDPLSGGVLFPWQDLVIHRERVQ